MFSGAFTKRCYALILVPICVHFYHLCTFSESVCVSFIFGAMSPFKGNTWNLGNKISHTWTCKMLRFKIVLLVPGSFLFLLVLVIHLENMHCRHGSLAVKICKHTWVAIVYCTLYIYIYIIIVLLNIIMYYLQCPTPTSSSCRTRMGLQFLTGKLQ